MPPKPLLFVNKTSKSESLSRSTGREKKQIFSHVQQDLVKDAVFTAFHVHKWWAIDDENDESSNVPRSHSRSRQQANSGRRRNPRGGRDIIAASSAGSPAQARLARGSHVPQASSIPKALEFDPEALVDLDALVVTYMAKIPVFFGSRFAIQMFPSQSAAGAVLQHTLSLAAQSLAARNALLCSAASIMSLMSGEAIYTEHSIYLKGTAIYRLRKQVAQDAVQISPNSTICAISMLLFTECLQGNFSHIVAHVSGLQQILSRVEISEQLSASEKAAVFGTSDLCSVMLRTPPLRPSAPSERHPLQLDIDEYARQQLDPGYEHAEASFFAAGNARIIGPKLLNLAARQKARCFFRETRHPNGKTAEYSDARDVACEALTVNYQLLSLVHGGSGSEISHVQNAVRLCLWLVTQPMIGLMGPASAISRSVTEQLYESLEKSDINSLWAPQHHLLLWVLFITAYFSEQGARWPWLMGKIRQLLGILDVSSREEFEGILQGFIFVKDLVDGMLDKIWSDAHPDGLWQDEMLRALATALLP